MIAEGIRRCSLTFRSFMRLLLVVLCSKFNDDLVNLGSWQLENKL